MGKLEDLKNYNFTSLAKKTQIDDNVKLLENNPNLLLNLENLRKDIQTLKKEVEYGEITSNLDILLVKVPLNDEERVILLDEIKELEHLLEAALEEQKQSTNIDASNLEYEVLLNQKTDFIIDKISQKSNKDIFSFISFLEVYEKAENLSFNSIKKPQILDALYIVLGKKLLEVPTERISDDPILNSQYITTIKKRYKEISSKTKYDKNATKIAMKSALDAINTKSIPELLTYISSLEKDIGDDKLAFEIGEKQIILSEADTALGKKLLENPDKIDEIKNNFPIKSIERAIFGYLTQDPLFSKRYKQAYDNTTVVGTETYIPEDVEGIKRFEVFKISVNHENLHIKPELLDDIFKNKLGLSTTDIGESLGLHLELGKKISKLEEKYPDLMDTIGKHGVLGAVHQLINKTKMGRGHKGAAMVFAELAAMGGIFYGIFKTVKEFGFFKGIGALLLGEFTAAAVTGHGAFDLVGRLIYGGLDQVDFSGATGKTKEYHKYVGGDKEKKKELGTSLLTGMMLGEEMKISKVKSFMTLDSGKLVFDVEKFQNSLPKGDWRKDFLENMKKKIGYDKVAASFVEGLEKIGINATSYDSMEDVTIGALFDKKREDAKKKAAKPRGKKNPVSDGKKTKVKDSQQPVAGKGAEAKKPIISHEVLLSQDLEELKKSATDLLAVAPMTLLAPDVNLSGKKQAYEGARENLEESLEKTDISKEKLLNQYQILKTTFDEYNSAIVIANESVAGINESIENNENIFTVTKIGYTKKGKNYIIGPDGNYKEVDIYALNPELKECLKDYENVSAKIDDLLFLLGALVKNNPGTYSSIMDSFHKELDSNLEGLELSNISNKVSELKKLLNSTLVSISGPVDPRSTYTPLQTLCNSFYVDDKGRRNDILNYIRNRLSDVESVKIDIIDRRFTDYTSIDEKVIYNLIEKLNNTDIDTLINIINSEKEYSSIKTLLRTKKNIEEFVENLHDKYEDAEDYYKDINQKVLKQATELYPDDSEERNKFISDIKNDIKHSFLLMYCKNLLMSHKLEKESAWDEYKGSDKDLKLIADIEGIGWLDTSDDFDFWMKETFMLVGTEILALAAGAVTFGGGTGLVNAAVTFGGGTGLVNAAVYGARGTKLVKYAYKTAKYADRAFRGAAKLEKLGIASLRVGRWATKSAVGGLAFYGGMGGMQTLLEGKSMYSREGLEQSIVFMGAFKALDGVYGALGKTIDYTRPLWEQKIRITSQFLLEGTVLSGIGLGFEGNLKPGDWTAETIFQAFVMAGLLKGAGMVNGKYSFKVDGKKVLVEKMEVNYNNDITVLTDKKTSLYRKRRSLRKKKTALETKKSTLIDPVEIAKIEAKIQGIETNIADVSTKLSLITKEIAAVRTTISNLESSITDGHIFSYDNFSKDIWYKLPKKGEALELYKNGNHHIFIRNVDGKFNLVIEKNGTTAVVEFKNKSQLGNQLRDNIHTNDFKLLVENNYKKVLNEKIDVLIEKKGAKFKMGGEEYRVVKVGDKKLLQRKDGSKRWKEENLDDFFDANYESIVDNYLKGLKLVIKKNGWWNKKLSTTSDGTTPPSIPGANAPTTKWGKFKDWTYGDLWKWMKILKSDATGWEKIKVSLKKIFLGSTEGSTTSGKFWTGAFLLSTFGESILEGKYEDHEGLGTLADGTLYSDIAEFGLYNVVPIIGIALDSAEYFIDSPSTGGKDPF